MNRTILPFFERMTTVLSEPFAQIGPSAVWGLIVLCAGVGLAMLLRKISVTIADRTFNALSRNGRGTSGLNSERIRRPIAEVIGTVTFWGTILLSLLYFLEIVGTSLVSRGMDFIGQSIPRLIGAIVVVAIGVIASVIVSSIVETATRVTQLGTGLLIRRFVQLTIGIVTGVTAVEQLGIDITFLSQFLLLAGGIMFAVTALTIGIGLSPLITGIFTVHLVQKEFPRGALIKTGQFEGNILKYTPIGVMLETVEGRILIPSTELRNNRIFISRESA